MKTNKILLYGLIIFIAIDLIHYFLIRMNHVLITESYYESKEITFIKLLLCVLALLGLVFSNKNKASSYLTLVASFGMIYLFLFKGPLHYFFLWYSTISLWVLFFLGLYLLYTSIREIRNNNTW